MDSYKEKCLKIREMLNGMILEIDLILEKNKEEEQKVNEIMAREEEPLMKSRKPVEETIYYRVINDMKWNGMQTYAEIGRKTNITSNGVKGEIERLRGLQGFGHRIIVDSDGRVGFNRETKSHPTMTIIRIMRDCAFKNPARYPNRNVEVNPKELEAI